MTWTYREDHAGVSVADRAMTRGLAEAYNALGAELQAPVVPAGLAFQAGLDQGLDLYSDVKHQNEAGTYLVACTFFGFLCGRTPVGLNYAHGLDPAAARRLQEIAWQNLGNPPGA